MGAQPRCSLPVGRVLKPLRNESSTKGSRTFGSTRRTEENFIVFLVPSVEAWAVAVSPGTQETTVMPEAALLAARTSVSAGE